MLQEEDAVEVVDLVAEGAGEKIFAANFKGFALGVLRAYGHELRADDVAAKAWNGEATLFLADFALRVNDFRIDEHNLGFGIFSGGDVHHGETQAQSNLRGREADP